MTPCRTGYYRGIVRLFEFAADVFSVLLMLLLPSLCLLPFPFSFFVVVAISVALLLAMELCLHPTSSLVW